MRRGGAFVIVALCTLSFLTWLLVRHAMDLSTSPTNFALAYAAMFLYLAVTVVASFAQAPHTVEPGFELDSLEADVFVPIYNEDPSLLAACITSMAAQDRPVAHLWLVDDGSTAPAFDHAEVQQAIARVEAVGTEVHTHRQANGGKREAQAWGFRRSSADVFVTVDSDTVLHPDALGKLLIPFSRDDVMCVGGMAVGQNHKRSLFTRVVELGFVMAFLSGRMAEGFFGAVRVNCGILAAYRGAVVRDNLDRYLTQTFLGHPVKIGDDRALTIFCKERGRAEFQCAAVAYSALPESMSHLVRQRIRWARSWYWGTLWLLRRRVTSVDFLLTFAQIVGMVSYLSSIVFAIVGTASGVISPRLLGWTLLTSIVIGYFTTLRYVVAGRPDESLGSRAVTWLLSPLSSVLYLVVLVPLYWVALFSLRPKGWGTRAHVEVGLHALSGVDAADHAPAELARNVA